MRVTRRSVRTALGACALGCTSVVATLAVAQPHARSGRPPSVRVDAGAAPPGDGADAGSGPTVAAPSTAGPVPPPTSDETSDGGRLSPLTPAADEFPDAGLAPATTDYERLLAEIAALRARVAAVSDTLFHSRVAIALEASGDHARVAALSVSLDDGVVWTAPAHFRPESETVVYEHAVAPGHHAITVDVDRRDDRDDTLRASQRTRFVVDVPADRSLSVRLTLSDDSDMAHFASSGEGRYELRVRARVRAEGSR